MTGEPKLINLTSDKIVAGFEARRNLHGHWPSMRSFFGKRQELHSEMK